jgi:hypothetical protein
VIWSELVDLASVGLMVGLGLAIQDPRNPAAIWIAGIACVLHTIAAGVPGARPLFVPRGGWRGRAGLTYIGLAIAALATMFWMLFRPSPLSIGTLIALTVVRMVYRRVRFIPSEPRP